MLLKSLATVLLLGASSLLVPQDDEPAKSGAYAIDATHSSVLFRVQHLGVSNFHGRFNAISGTVQYDPAKPEECSIELTIPTESIDSNSEGRDKHLVSPDFFSAKEFPELRFTSKRVKAGAGGALAVTGELSMHGVTREVTVDATPVGHGDRGRMGYRAGFDAEFTIKRSDFGMDYMVGMLGDEVRVTIALETALP